ncbi:Phosphatidylinositol N-acetylglucosaminyltransferase subunit P [Acorus gramineus]|uniref:Phosphatidylinositol N-acetylglucosaminyltransferase subunit P n=1 Tax=Acorus gramineus TaxID=55184 RepID=A0AAV9B0W6_ACOGR|nr:Phosphatidylinositol N-acetylglucosaminyltransferase subunit P [Acorus gramineus]
MAESQSSPLNSPTSGRRTLSFSRRERARVSISVEAEGVASPRSPQPQSLRGVPKLSEVYGFVGSISTVVAMVIFFVWAYIPEPWLHSLGITYYPSRYWALAVPTYAIVTIVLALAFYLGSNFIVTPPPTSFNTMFDQYSRERPTFINPVHGKERPIDPISDIGIDHINELMFNTR